MTGIGRTIRGGELPLPTPVAGRERLLSGSESRHGLLLLRKVHRAQESLVARVAAKAAEQGINLDPRESRISAHIGALEPLECLVLLAEPGIYAGGPVGIVQGD